MTEPRRLPLAPLLPLALCLALGGVIYVELDQPPIDASATAAPAPRSEATGTSRDNPGFAMPPLRGYAEVVERPLFSETRRPSVEAAPVDPRSSAFNLVGIVISAQQRHALIEHGQPPRLEHATEGQEIDGWTVESIQRDRVVLQRGDLRLEVKAKDGPASPAAFQPGQPRRPTAAVPMPTIDPSLGAINLPMGLNVNGGEPTPVSPPRRDR